MKKDNNVKNINLEEDIKLLEKKKLLEEICNFYNYNLIYKNNKIITDGYTKEYYFKYNDIDEALKGWLKTLEETNYCNASEGLGNYYTWTRKEINIIKSITDN